MSANPHECDVCLGTGVSRAERDPDTGIWDAEDCWGCNGTGDVRNYDDSPYNTANYPNRETA